MESDGFKKVSYKNRKSKSKSVEQITKSHFKTNIPGLPFDKVSSVRRISEAKLELASTDLFDSLIVSLKEGLLSLNKSTISEIICLGLGKIGECVTSRYQFALILCLKEFFDGTVFAYDPIFSENDKKLLNYFNVTVLEENLEGKYKIVDEKQVLFFLPHCPKQLTNNLLWANWSLNLSSCIIISNSFNQIVDSCSMKTLKDSAEYISKITPYVLELPIINSFKYYDIFNDLAIHVFPNLNIVSQDLWCVTSEPKYIEEDIEFITQVSTRS